MRSLPRMWTQGTVKWTLTLMVVLGSGGLRPAVAHEGPPYPILVDRRAGPYTLSVWADPDVGIGTFYITPESAVPADLAVELWVQPADRRIPEVRFPAVRREGRGPLLYVAEARFATEERWRTRVVLRSSEGTGEIETEVEVTPPGLGPFDLLLYAAPFAAIAFLWIKAVMNRRSRQSALP